jgi:Zn-dependent M28 family amino/carboxypeptidase
MIPRLALALLGTSLAACSDATPEPSGCPAPLAEQLSDEALRAHLTALADIADAHAGNRAAGTLGYEASADYVARTLAAAGFSVVRQPFIYLDFELLGTPVFAELAPVAVDHPYGGEFRVARFSAGGDVSGLLVPVDLSLGTPEDSTSGCQADDWLGFPPGAVALLQRGGCLYDDKLVLAEDAGAAAVVFFNQGDADVRRGLFTPRLSAGVATIPAIALSYDLGAALSATLDLEVRVAVSARVRERTAENVLAETRPTDGPVIMAGAHLDSVPAGPGINDNGSGVAAVLELGVQLARCDLPRQVRVAFWGAEELGLYGSAHYVDSLTDAEAQQIAVYLNLDMIASPNPVRFLYDGDGSAFGQVGPDGSAALEAALLSYYAGRGLPTRETPFDGRSDYGPFIARGIAAGGIFTGAEDVKTADEAQQFGGEPEVPYDPCYHAACDDRDNFSADELLENARAAAHVLEAYASGSSPLAPAAAPRRAAATRVHAHACQDDAE